MTISSSSTRPLISQERLFKKPLLFKSFTGLTLKEFDNIYDKEISKRYEKLSYSVYQQKENIQKEKEELVL